VANKPKSVIHTCGACGYINSYESKLCKRYNYPLIKSEVQDELRSQEQEIKRLKQRAAELETKLTDIHHATYVYTKERESVEREKDQEIEEN
jgi:hypothetical protein